MTRAEQRRAAMKALRDKWYALGLCYYCKAAPFKAGASMCEACSLRRKKYMATRTADLLAAGTCYACAKRPRVEGQRHCVECSARHAVNANKSREKFKALGICPTCRKGQLSADGRGGVSRCPICYVREQKRSKRNYDAVKSSGLCVQCFKAPVVAGKTSCVDCTKRRTLRRFAEQGLTAAQLDAMSDRCEVCDSTESLHIDHCHTSNVVRGRLCQHCNHALGLVKEDRAVILKLLAYVDKWKPVKSTVDWQAFSDQFYRGKQWTKTEPELPN